MSYDSDMKALKWVGVLLAGAMISLWLVILGSMSGCGHVEKRPKMGKCKHPRFGEYNCEIDTMGRPK